MGYVVILKLWGHILLQHIMIIIFHREDSSLTIFMFIYL
jgi:hypothetical protein